MHLIRQLEKSAAAAPRCFKKHILKKNTDTATASCSGTSTTKLR